MVQNPPITKQFGLELCSNVNKEDLYQLLFCRTEYGKQYCNREKRNYEEGTESNEHIYPTMNRRYIYKNKRYQ